MSQQVGTDYTYQYAETAAAQTTAKVQILEKKNPDLGKVARSIFLGTGDIDTALQSLDKVSADRLRGLFVQEIAIAGSSNNSLDSTAPGTTTDGNLIDNIASGAVGSIQGFTDRAIGSFSKTVDNINKAFKPASRELGQTIGNVTSMVKDPLGTISLIPGSIKNVIERNNPEFAADLEATYKKFKIEQLQHIPTILSGSLRMIDSVLTLPFIILSDLYNGLLDIITAIADAIDSIISSFIKILFEQLFDGIILEVIELLNEITALASQIQGIAALYSGSNFIVDFAFNLQIYSGQLSSFLSNPLDLLFAYAPPQVSEALYLLRNPQELINNILPPEINNAFAPLAKITGFGFNGNMGYGFVSVIEGLRSGVLSSVLTNFANQYPILTPILGTLNGLNIIPNNPPVPPTIAPSPVNPNRTIVQQGVTQPQEPPKDVVKSSTTPSSETGRGRFNARNSPATIAAQRRSADYAAMVAAGFARGTTTGDPGLTRGRVDI